MTKVARDLESLCEELAPDLLGYFIRRVVPTEDAADLVNETFMAMCRRPSAIPTDPREARMWAFGIARKVLQTHRRGSARRSALVERLRQEAAVTLPLPEGADDLHLAMGQLDPLDQEIIRLVHWEGFTQTEVASLLHMPAATIRSRHLRARATLKQTLEVPKPLAVQLQAQDG